MDATKRLRPPGNDAHKRDATKRLQPRREGQAGTQTMHKKTNAVAPLLLILGLIILIGVIIGVIMVLTSR